MKENLEIKENIPNSGLLDDFKTLVSTSNEGPGLIKRIIEFMEKHPILILKSGLNGADFSGHSPGSCPGYSPYDYNN